MTASVFPVRAASGAASYVSTFGAPRSGGRKHQGVDIYAPRGSAVLAVADGYAQPISGTLTGLGVALTDARGAVYIYAHLDDYAGAALPRRVKAGENLGSLGTSGNASGGRPHLHFEVRPDGKTAVDPAPILERLALPMPAAPLVAIPRKPAPKAKASKFGGLNTKALMVPLALFLAVKAHEKRGKHG